jgi:hypothetical protein
MDAVCGIHGRITARGSDQIVLFIDCCNLRFYFWQDSTAHIPSYAARTLRKKKGRSRISMGLPIMS